MNIDNKKTGNILVVTLQEKRLDSPLCPDFESIMKNWIADGETCILLDLTNVNSVDSAGLGSIVSCLKSLKTSNSEGYLALAGISEQVMSLFKLTRMDRVFPIYPDQAAALQNL